MKLLHANIKWKRKDKILLLERLELYVQAGLTIDQSFRVAEEGIPKKQKRSLECARKIIEQGGSTARALAEHVRISKTLSGLISHGESSGGLGKAFSSARSLLEREDELKKKCAGAMIYPVVIGLFACVLTIGLVKGVMPQIIPMFESLHVELPLMTKIVIAISEYLLKYGMTACSIAVLFAACSVLAYKKMPSVRFLFHKICLAVPVLGALLRKYALVVFLQSCGTLIESGASVSEAFEGTAKTVPLLPLRNSLMKGVAGLARGMNLGTVMADKKMPPFVAPLLSAGEMSGLLGGSMVRASQILDRDIENTLKNLTALIEPAMMVIMGGVVAVVALSIMMPIYDLSKVLQK